MTTITPPKASIPIGIVTINGQEYQVRQHPEIIRFFFDLFRRVGGVDTADSSTVANTVDATRLGVFGPRQAPKEPADIQFINAFARRQEAPAQLQIANIAAFMPRPPQQSTPLADSSSVVCSRVFRQR